MAKYTQEELSAFQEKIKDFKSEDLQKLSPKELKMFQYLQCPFCQIIDGIIPSKPVYDDDACRAVLDINPAGEGHVLIIPKEHYQVGPQVPDNVMDHLGIITKKLSSACIKGLKCSGTHIFAANGLTAGQKAQHFMIHIIPRFDGDKIDIFKLKRASVNEKELEDLAKNLRDYLAKLFGGNIVEETQEIEETISKPIKVKEKPIKEKGYLYFLDSVGDISRVKMKRKGEPKSPHEKVMKLGVERQPGLLYYIDANLDVQSRPMNRKGRPKGKKNKHPKKEEKKTVTKTKKIKSKIIKQEKKASLDDIANLFTK